MKNSITKALLFSFLALFLFASCNKKNVNDAYIDVYVQAKTEGSATMYSLYQWAYSYDQMSAVEVTDPFGDTYALENFENKGYSFSKEDPYASIYPLDGNYTFKVTFQDGEVKTYYNKVNIVAFTSVQNLKTKDTTHNNSQALKISWNKLDAASVYQVVIKKPNGDELIRSPFMMHDPAKVEVTSIV